MLYRVNIPELTITIFPKQDIAQNNNLKSMFYNNKIVGKLLYSQVVALYKDDSAFSEFAQLKEEINGTLYAHIHTEQGQPPEVR